MYRRIKKVAILLKNFFWYFFEDRCRVTNWRQSKQSIGKMQFQKKIVFIGIFVFKRTKSILREIAEVQNQWEALGAHEGFFNFRGSVLWVVKICSFLFILGLKWVCYYSDLKSFLFSEFFMSNLKLNQYLITPSPVYNYEWNMQKKVIFKKRFVRKKKILRRRK